MQVARAIHHAHEHGVVHRDLKPANIMLLDRDASGSAARSEAAVKIMDFGVARLESLGPRITRTGQAFGSPLYMSPEQALGQPSSARSDIFSLGSVLCTLVLGRPWFEAPNLPKIVDRLAHDDPPRLSRLRPGVPPSLDLVVAKALAKLEAERYRSAAEMADDLEDVLAGRPARHAFGPASTSRGGASDEELLLAGLAAAPSGPRRPGPHDPLASLLDEATRAGDGADPGLDHAHDRRSAGPFPPALAGGGAVRVGGSRSRRLVPANARRARARGAAPCKRSRGAVRGADTRRGEGVPAAGADDAAAGAAHHPRARLRSDSRGAAAVAAPTVRAVRPTATPTPPAVPVTEPPAVEVPVVAEPAAAPAGSRIRLAVTHPFEDGRLIVWIDGVLVHEAKLQASSSRRIVAFKVREGSAQSMLEVTPGPHEVRVEVTWNQGRTTRTKVVDVADGATGLLEARVGRMSKDLSLAWSRLAKD